METVVRVDALARAGAIDERQDSCHRGGWHRGDHWERHRGPRPNDGRAVRGFGNRGSSKQQYSERPIQRQASGQSSVKPGNAAGPSSTGAPGGAAKPSAGSVKPPPPAPASQEALPQVSASSHALPVPKPPAPLIRGPLPATASAQGKIVAGFPRDVLSFPRGTVVGSTAVSASDGALQVAADAIVALNQDSVVGHFQQILGARKFWSEPVPAAQGQRAVRFSRGKDSLTLTTRSTGTGATRFMLLGNLHPAASG